MDILSYNFFNLRVNSVSVAPEDHTFYQRSNLSLNSKFIQALNNDLKILRSGLPEGIWVKHYEDRMDLLSVMIRGPNGTIYEDGIFIFDILLPCDYPIMPPILHFHSRCHLKINPNLYTCGKVCLSLLGTWTGTASECWNKSSTLFQLFISIQSLVLVREPYYNEPGTTYNLESSKIYNAMACKDVINSLKSLGKTAPIAFANEIKTHILNVKWTIINRLDQWKRMENVFFDKYLIKKEPYIGVDNIINEFKEFQ